LCCASEADNPSSSIRLAFASGKTLREAIIAHPVIWTDALTAPSRVRVNGASVDASQALSGMQFAIL
jgi:hypothetical protein